METRDRSDNLSSALAYPDSTLPEYMYNLSCLAEIYELGTLLGKDVEPQELYLHILTHMRQTIQAPGACLLLYHNAQKHFIPIAHQGEKLHCGNLANSIHAREVAQLAAQGPGATLDTRHVKQQNILLVTLNYQKTLIGLVALAIPAQSSLLEARKLLLAYMGNIAGGLLYHQRQQSIERTQIIEQERNRIARDLHDSVAQQITFILYKLEYVQRLLEKNQSQKALLETKRAATILSESLQELRVSINSLRPAPLDQHTLTEAFITLIQHYQINNPHMRIEQNLSELMDLPERLEIPIFRLLQEALANIYKHAQATEVKIYVSTHNSCALVEISDNGRGLPTQYHYPAPEEEDILVDVVASHMGLRTMRERVQEAGGSWQFDSQPGIGTTLKASFPLHSSSIELTSREREILRLIVEGLSNRAIAKQLTISSATVKTHTHHIMHKLQAKDRAQAAIIATNQGWI